MLWVAGPGLPEPGHPVPPPPPHHEPGHPVPAAASSRTTNRGIQRRLRSKKQNNDTNAKGPRLCRGAFLYFRKKFQYLI